MMKLDQYRTCPFNFFGGSYFFDLKTDKPTTETQDYLAEFTTR